jgi:hypothetical protein
VLLQGGSGLGQERGVGVGVGAGVDVSEGTGDGWTGVDGWCCEPAYAHVPSITKGLKVMRVPLLRNRGPKDPQQYVYRLLKLQITQG